MDISEKGLVELIGHEGIIQTRYRNGSGDWAIGIAHTGVSGQPDPAAYESEMPLDQVVAVFRRDLREYIDAVNEALRGAVAAHEFDALVSFHFNTGAIGRAGLVASLNAGHRARAARELLDWRRPPEVIRRRTREQRLFADGIYSNDGRATVYHADQCGRVQWGMGRQIDVADYL